MWSCALCPLYAWMFYVVLTSLKLLPYLDLNSIRMERKINKGDKRDSLCVGSRFGDLHRYIASLLGSQPYNVRAGVPGSNLIVNRAASAQTALVASPYKSSQQHE